MVKMEHANTSVSVFDPVAPPGFPPNPPETSATNTAVVSAIEQTSKENEFTHGNELRKSPDLSAEQSHRRVQRKRTRPEFYKPPTPRRPAASPRPPGASPRRRGRPPKARLISLLSNQERQTRNSNEVSSSTTTKEQSNSQPNYQVGLETSTRGNTRAGSLDQKWTGTIGRTLIDENMAHIAKAIIEKHGNIFSECPVESDYMRTHVVICVCQVVQDLQNKHLKDIDDVSSLDTYYTAVRDLEIMKVNVRWLHNRLDEIKDAVNLSNEAKSIAGEKNRIVEEMDRKKKEVERLESELARGVTVVVELKNKYNDCMSKISRFDHTCLLDGLL